MSHIKFWPLSQKPPQTEIQARRLSGSERGSNPTIPLPPVFVSCTESWEQGQRREGGSLESPHPCHLQTCYSRISTISLATQDAEQEADHVSQSYLQTSIHFLLIKAQCGDFVHSNHCLKPVMQTTEQDLPQPEAGCSMSLNSKSR